jgi:hypothetical protein
MALLGAGPRPRPLDLDDLPPPPAFSLGLLRSTAVETWRESRAFRLLALACAGAWLVSGVGCAMDGPASRTSATPAAPASSVGVVTTPAQPQPAAATPLAPARGLGAVTIQGAPAPPVSGVDHTAPVRVLTFEELRRRAAGGAAEEAPAAGGSP